MRLTNNHGLPEPFMAALSRDLYHQDGHISVTGLIQPPRIRQLSVRHDAQISEDVSDRIWMLLGSLVHDLLERSVPDNALSEERMSVNVGGWKVTGQADLLEADGTLSDYKVTSTWAVLNDIKPDWVTQTNLYAHLYRQAGFSVNKIQIVAVLRDWSTSRAKSGGDYPACACKVLPVPTWSHGECETYLTERVFLHKQAADLSDDALPYCTPEERWEKPTIYAVMKKGRKSALRLLDSHEEAERWMWEKEKGDSVDVREGESTRCERYCAVGGNTGICNQHRELLSLKNAKT